ncbi:MAG: hypothetical protein ABI852_10640 [Gemmatimonadaceae bacterium]
MTFLLFKRYLAEPRLIWSTVMVSSMFAMGGDIGLPLAFLSTFVTLVVYPNRSSLFESALPISARTILRARLLANYAFALAPVVAWFAAMRFSRYAQLSRDTMPDMFGLRPLTAVDRVALCVVVLIAATIPFAIRPRESKTPPRVQVIGAVVCLVAGSVSMLSFLPPQFNLLITVIVALSILWWTLHNTPQSFQVASFALEKESATSGFSRAQSAMGNVWIVPVVRSLLTPQWFIFTVLLILQSSLGNWIQMVGIQFALSLRQKSAWLGAFPISRRTRLLVTFVPAMIGTFGAIVAGQFLHVPGLNGHKFNPISWQAVSTPYEHGKYFSSPTSTKLMFWEIAPDEIAPVITSPSGESVTAYTLKVPGFMLYNPYSSDEKSSKNFVAWQYARASTRVYGHEVPLPGSYEEGLVFPKPLYSAPRVQILNASAVLCVLFLLYLGAEFARYPAPRGKGPVQYFGEAFPILPGITCIAIDGYYGTSHGTQIVVPLAKRLLLNLSDALPSNILVVVLVAAIPVAILYALIEWQFARTEFVPVAVVKKP